MSSNQLNEKMVNTSQIPFNKSCQSVTQQQSNQKLENQTS